MMITHILITILGIIITSVLSGETAVTVPQRLGHHHPLVSER